MGSIPREKQEMITTSILNKMQVALDKKYLQMHISKLLQHNGNKNDYLQATDAPKWIFY